MKRRETLYATTDVASPTVLTSKSLIRSDVAYKYYTKKYGSNKIRIWKDTKAAKTDASIMRRRGYKVKMTPDNKSVIILGKTTRGYEKTSTGKRAVKSPSQRRSTISRTLQRKKPYTPSGYSTFRQPSRTLRKLGWER